MCHRTHAGADASTDRLANAGPDARPDAGADRVSQGMRCSYGKNVGTAARVKRGQTVISINTKPEFFVHAKNALRKASMKFPTPCSMVITKGSEHLKGVV